MPTVVHDVSMRDSVLCGLFWRPDGSGGHPSSRGWPLHRLTMSRQGAALEPSTFLGRPHITFSWGHVERVERVSRGLRFRFADPDKTFVVGSPLGAKRFLQLVNWYCPPDLFDAWVHPVSSLRWDPAE